MSYCRFGWDGSDFYIYSDGETIHVYGPGVTQFAKGEEQELIDYLHAQQKVGRTVPQAVFDRLEAERDGRPYRTTVEEALDEIKRNPQMFSRSLDDLAEGLAKEVPNTAVTEPFVCPRCKKTSWHPEDARQGYCGACHAFTGVCDPEKDRHVDPHRGCALR